MSTNSEYSVRTEDICESDCSFSHDFFIKTCSIRGMNDKPVSDCQTWTQSSYGSQMRRLLLHLPSPVRHLVPQRPQPRNPRFNPRGESTGSIVIPKTVSSIFTPSVHSDPPVEPKTTSSIPTTSSVDSDLPVTPKRFIKINDRPSTPQAFRDQLQTYIPKIRSPNLRDGEEIRYDERYFKLWWKCPITHNWYLTRPGPGVKMRGTLAPSTPVRAALGLFPAPRRSPKTVIPAPVLQPQTLVDDIKPPVDTPWDPLQAGIQPAFTIHDPDLLVDDSFSSSTFTREGAPSPSPSPSPPFSEESLYPDSQDTTSSSSSFDEAFLADDERTSLIVPFPCSPPPPNNTPESTPPPEQQPELLIFQRGWRWIKSWFTS